VNTDVSYTATYTLLGEDTQTHSDIVIADLDRYSGMYILGRQGVGKSSLLEWQIYQDIAHKDTAVFVIDPHGDLIEHVIAQMPERKRQKTYLFDVEDIDYPFGLNPFAISENATASQQQQALDRVLHVFEKSFPDTSHMLLEKYLGNIAPVFFAHATEGYGVTDIPKFLKDDTFRKRLLADKKLNYFIKSFWQDEYEAMTPSKRQTETASLATRLNRFVRSPIVANIIGQGRTTIDFRKAIENREILLIKLPLKTLKEDSEFIGTILVAQIHAAIFSFADISAERRPGFSLFVDEFEHFATTDFAEMFAEGRKYGVRLCLAHQTRTQIPDTLKVLKSTTMNAATVICFATTDDASEMARLFPGKPELDPAPMPQDTIKYLLHYGHTHPQVSEFATSFLPFLQKNATGKFGRPQGLIDLNALFHACMREGNANRDIPVSTMKLVIQSLFNFRMDTSDRIAIEPFFNKGAYDTPSLDKPKQAFFLFCKSNVFSMREQLQQIALQGSWKLHRDYKKARVDAIDNILYYISLIRATMQEVAKNPLGDLKAPSTTQVASLLISLPKRHALVKMSNSTYQMRTVDTPRMVTQPEQQARKHAIQSQTRQRYCRPASQVESEIMQRLKAKEDEEEEAKDATGSVAGNVPRPLEVSESPLSLQVPSTQQELDEQTRKPLPASMDSINTLYAQMRAREIDSDTTILASLGEHYVITIKQWMRLFEWGSYPRATQYFKELRENDWIYRKDREGRGGKLVEGDWFFLLTKGANELVRRKQPSPLFKLEPNEAEKTSGDTLVHTYLVNEILIHLRLLERTQPGILTIERIDHERIMRRNYLNALGADSKLYPDGFLRLLVPTANGLKRRYLFLELQHTTQRDEANWKTKCRKYLALFDSPDNLEKFFRSRTPLVLVITMDTSYVSYHKQWTEEVLQEAGERGRAYRNRFLIGSYDTDISDMRVEPLEFFCTPRFSQPFTDTPYPVFALSERTP